MIFEVSSGLPGNYLRFKRWLQKFLKRPTLKTSYQYLEVGFCEPFWSSHVAQFPTHGYLSASHLQMGFVCFMLCMCVMVCTPTALQGMLCTRQPAKHTSPWATFLCSVDNEALPFKSTPLSALRTSVGNSLGWVTHVIPLQTMKTR